MGVPYLRSLKAFGISFKILKGDKVAIFLSLLPVTIGLIGLYFFSEWFFTGLPEKFLQQLGSGMESSRFLKGLLVALLAILYYFIVNLLFVMLVSVVASPFNDLLSARVGKNLGEAAEAPSSQIFLKRAVRVWFNEFKKIVCIGGLTVLSFLLGFFPPLIPLSIVLSSLLLAAGFLDYSWSRHNLPIRECLKDIKRYCWSYGLSGFLFLFAFTIPVVNVFLVPYAVAYYTVMYVGREADTV